MKYFKLVWQVLLICTCGMGASCRQPDGTLPVPVGEQPNKVADIARDLENLAAGDQAAVQDLFDDLDNLDSYPRPRAELQALVDALRAALQARPLDKENARRLADTLFVAVTARDLSERQIARMGTELRDRVLEAGAESVEAGRAEGAAVALARLRTENRSRWYHVF